MNDKEFEADLMSLKARWFKLIRPLFVKDIDPNEDFVCGQCMEPVLRRTLFCSTDCYVLHLESEVSAAAEVIKGSPWYEDINILQKECARLREAVRTARREPDVARYRAALQRIVNGTHEEHPTCMSLSNGQFGPPRTNGWEGWAHEIDATHKQIAKDALEGN